MATFQVQVQGITQLTVGTTPTTGELTQFLTDGGKEVIGRIISVNPAEIPKFTTSTSESSNAGITIKGQVMSVVREHDSTSILRRCSPIDPMLRYEATDTDSLSYRSKYNPGFYQLNGKIFLVPISAGSSNAAIVTQINYPTVGFGDDGIDNFPSEYIYLVVLYASIKTIHAHMSVLSMPAEPVFEDLPTDLAEAAIVFGSLTEKAVSTINTGDMTTGTTGAVPAYTTPSTALTAFSITSVSPDTPTVPDFEIALTKALPSFTAPSAYSAPVVSGISGDITDGLTSGDSQVDFGDWWEKWGDFIEDNDDPELAGAHGGKVGAFISAYQAAVGNKLNVYNTSLQSNLNQFNSDIQAYQAELAVVVGEVQIEKQAEHAANLQQYQAEIATYQAEVAAEVQEYGQKLTRFNAEMQDATQTFQSNSALFQADMQKLLAEYQADVQMAIRNADHQAQQELEKKTRDMEALIQDYTLGLQNFQAKIAKYQADAAISLQLYQADIQRKGVEYQWLQDQYSRLKAEYDASFPSPPREAEPERARA